MTSEDKSRSGLLSLPALVLERMRQYTWQELVIENLIRLAGFSAVLIIALIFFFLLPVW